MNSGTRYRMYPAGGELRLDRNGIYSGTSMSAVLGQRMGQISLLILEDLVFQVTQMNG